MAAGFPQIEPHDVRREDEIIAPPQKFLAQPILDNFANQAALGVPENKARAGFLLDTEEVQLGSEPAMIAPLGFFQAMQVFV